MDYRKIIAEAWSDTQKDKSVIIWFGFLPALLTTTAGILYMTYQIIALKKSFLFDNSEESFFHDVFVFLWDFISIHLSWTVPLVVLAIVLGVLYILFPTLAKAGAIQTIARKRNGQKSSVGTGIQYGIGSFLPLFEYHMIIKTFSFFAILIEMSFILRNLGPVIFQILLPVMLLVLIISIIATLLFTYTDFFIVIDHEPVFASIKKSSSLVFMHWKHTFLLSVLMILIGIRIIIQAAIIFMIPIVIIFITGYIATIALPATGVIIGGIVGIIALVLAAYMNGIVDVFSYTVWTYTFLELTGEEVISARESQKLEEVSENIDS